MSKSKLVFLALLIIVAVLTLLNGSDPLAGFVDQPLTPEVKKKISDCEKISGFVGSTERQKDGTETFLRCRNPLTGETL